MTLDQLPPNSIPEWYLVAMSVMRNADRSVHNIDTDLRDLMTLDDIDPRLISEMQHLRDALGAVMVNLSAMDMIAEKVVKELAGSKSSDDNQAAGRQDLH